MIMTCLLGVLAGAVLWMDRVFLFQSMMSRPMIMGPLIGLVMGDLKAGLFVGVSLELLWLNSPPVGAYLPNDESFCAAIAVPVAVIAGSWAPHPSAAGLSILLSLPGSIAGRILDTRLRTMNERIIVRGEDAGEKEVPRAVGMALSRAFIMVLLLLGACIFFIGSIALYAGTILPEAAISALSLVPFACMVIGIAALVSREMPKKTHAGMFTLGLVLVLLLTWMI